MMFIDAKILNDRIKPQLDIQNNLFGEQFCTDLRPVAGKSAAKSGKMFEDICKQIMINGKIQVNKKPKFKCHFNLNRQGDFEIVTNDRKIHIECKQLGNVESHFDKLSHVFMNLVSGCYGDEMWLVYDYNGQINSRGKRYINALNERCIKLKKQMALQGVTFELVLVDNLADMVNNI